MLLVGVVLQLNRKMVTVLPTQRATPPYEPRNFRTTKTDSIQPPKPNITTTGPSISVKQPTFIASDIKFIMPRNYQQQEGQIDAAQAALQAGSITSIRAAATLFGVPYSTLSARIRGRESALNRQKAQLRLSVHEEAIISKAVYTLDRWGWPMSIGWLENMAIDLLRKKGDTKPLGHHWYTRFLERHPDLRAKWSRNRDQARSDAEDRNSVDRWFQLFQSIVAEKGIATEDIYNMDEKGFMKGIGEEVKVIIPRREGEAISCQPGNREWVTVIESISGGGQLLPAFVIFEGEGS